MSKYFPELFGFKTKISQATEDIFIYQVSKKKKICSNFFETVTLIGNYHIFCKTMLLGTDRDLDSCAICVMFICVQFQVNMYILCNKALVCKCSGKMLVICRMSHYHYYLNF